jgi:hypothetical protein
MAVFQGFLSLRPIGPIGPIDNQHLWKPPRNTPEQHTIANVECQYAKQCTGILTCWTHRTYWTNRRNQPFLTASYWTHVLDVLDRDEFPHIAREMV